MEAAQTVAFFENLETARLRLRPLSVEDADAIFREYAADLEAARYLTFIPHKTVETVRAFTQRCVDEMAAGSHYTYAIENLKTREFIGAITLTPEDHRLSLGYVLGKRFWGNGFMPEVVRAVCDWALSHPSIHRVWAVCDVDNLASARVMEKAGMAREGLLKKWSSHPNVSAVPRDCWCYAKIR